MQILRLNTKKAHDYVKKLKERNRLRVDKEEVVRRIIEDVRRKGDSALLKYTRKFDFPITDIKVSPGEIIEGWKNVERSYISSIDALIERIKNFEKRTIPKSWIRESRGVLTGQYVNPIESVGIYVPGGKASYPSSLLMCAVPAKMAGVKRIVVVSPPDKRGKINPHILVAASRLSIKEIYKAGGAQAIAALACGTQTIPKVEKIVGPGNIYVALAKKLVRGEVEIDTLAGPSEICILAASSANPQIIAADILSQAEHDRDAVCVCITPSMKLAEKIERQIQVQKRKLRRTGILNSALKKGAIIITRNISEGVEIVNTIAPEHLEILTENPFGILPRIKNAGAIFLGKYSPVAFGDYIAGPNHVIPTGGTARFSSPLSIRDFFKVSNVISCNADGFGKLVNTGIKLAGIEEMDAHINALKIRQKIN